MSQHLDPVHCWENVTKLLREKLGDADVAEITDKDFDAQGDLVFRGRAVRVMYAGTTDKALESQRTAYEDVHNFLAIVGDSDRRSTRDQAISTLKLAQQVRCELAGARVLLTPQERSEPITLVSVEPLPIKNVGVGYAIAFEIPGPAVFPGSNANPQLEVPSNG